MAWKMKWLPPGFQFYLAAVALLGAVLGACTWAGLSPLPASPADLPQVARKAQLLDRHGEPLTQTYRNPWNYTDTLALHQMPMLLQAAFVTAEDQRFFSHPGMDIRARLHALWQNLRARRVVRGASTI
ncbi:MAG: transglycosylase domain-containing protein, partial [Desulfobacterales bacterium]|nr:transglycosylase domain-containing protein [Desulfobacterales bacterium]